MSSVQFFITLILSICVFNVLVIWFLHKASVYFHRMDAKVGNTDREEESSFYNDGFQDNCLIIREVVQEQVKKQKAEKQEIVLT